MAGFYPTFTVEELQTEAWRTIEAFPAYEVSNLGRVRRPIPSIRRPKVGMLKLFMNTYGYHMIMLYRDGRTYTQMVHRLVAQAFIGPCPPGYTVNHKDFDKINNKPENLEYMTSGDNSRHAARHGYLARGERHGNAVLTEQQVREIRRLYAGGNIELVDIARIYPVSADQIGHIVRRQSWKHVL